MFDLNPDLVWKSRRRRGFGFPFVIGVNVGVCDSRPRLNNSCENQLKTLWRRLTLSMALSRSPTFPSWSLQRIISRRPGRISALLMPTSAPVTGRIIPPIPEVAGNATCWWVEGKKNKDGSWREMREKERIKETRHIKNSAGDQKEC